MSVTPDIATGLSLQGRVAVVTGAGKGIGQQTAVTLGAAGATVVLADVDKDGLEETASRIDRAVVVPTDVSIRADVDALALEAVRVEGRIDVWANVAGIIRTATILELAETDLDAVISVNLKGVVWGCAAAARVMSDAKRGSIINVASSGGETPAPFARGLRNDQGSRDPIDQNRRGRTRRCPAFASTAWPPAWSKPQ